MSKRRKKTQPATVPDPEASTYMRYPPAVPNPNANTWEYDLRPNVKAGEGQQWSMFGVSKKPRNVKGPKGFSPERQDDVRAKTSVYADSLAREKFGPDNWVEDPGSQLGEKLSRESSGHRQAARRMLQDTISQSTAPLPDRMVSVFTWDGDSAASHLKSSFIPNGLAAGNYNSKSASAHSAQINIGSQHFEKDPGHANRLLSQVLLHELGHHWSQETNPDKDYSTPEGQGREEAFADDFSVKHSPPSRYGNYASPYPDTGRGPGFREAYDTARTTPTESHWWHQYRNPNVPGGMALKQSDFSLGDQEIDWTTHRSAREQAVVDMHPTLPGMEDARPYIGKDARWPGVDHMGYKGPAYLEYEHQFADRTLNRQTEANRQAEAKRGRG